MNYRGVEEIASSEVAGGDGPQSVIRAQVSNGVAVRMAVLETVAGWLGAMSGALARPAHVGEHGRPPASKPRVLAHSHFEGDQHMLRLRLAPRCAARAQPAVASCTCAARKVCRCAVQCPSCAPTPHGRLDQAALQGWSARARAGSRALAATFSRQQSSVACSTARSARAFIAAPRAAPRPAAWRRGRHSADGISGRAAPEPSNRRPRSRLLIWRPLVLMGSELPPFPVSRAPVLHPRVLACRRRRSAACQHAAG